MQRINLLWTNGRDVHYPIDEPNPAHVKSWGRGKARPCFLQAILKVGAKFVPPSMPHGMSECLGQPLV